MSIEQQAGGMLAEEAEFLQERHLAAFHAGTDSWADYAANLGFTHVQFMPVMERSANQKSECAVAAYYAPDARCGAPQDLMFLIDYLHQRNLGVILDWAGADLPPDCGGLAYFDGTHLYEHGSWPRVTEDGQKAFPFDYSRPEVRSFLLSSAFFWLEQYHADGLGLGDVASRRGRL